MAAYVIMQPPVRGVEGATFLRDGFSIPAFLVAPFWLLWHRLWLEGILVLLAMILVGAVGRTAGLEFAGAVLSLLVSWFVGLEGTAMRMASFRRRGWTETAVIDAGSLASAETRFAFAAAPASNIGPVAQPSASHHNPFPDPVFGFWGSAGRR